METLRNYAILTIATCALAIGFGTKILTPDHKTAYQDTLSTAAFLSKTSANYAKEFNLAKQARTSTKISRIREYATKVMDACIVARTDMQPFAEKSGVTLADSSSVPADITKTKNKAGFDKNYLTASIANHQQMIANYEQAVLFPDTNISNMAEKHLLVLRRNLEMAKFMSKNIRNGKLIPDGPPKDE